MLQTDDKDDDDNSNSSLLLCPYIESDDSSPEDTAWELWSSRQKASGGRWPPAEVPQTRNDLLSILRRPHSPDTIRALSQWQSNKRAGCHLTVPFPYSSTRQTSDRDLHYFSESELLDDDEDEEEDVEEEGDDPPCSEDDSSSWPFPTTNLAVQSNTCPEGTMSAAASSGEVGG